MRPRWQRVNGCEVAPHVSRRRARGQGRLETLASVALGGRRPPRPLLCVSTAVRLRWGGDIGGYSNIASWLTPAHGRMEEFLVGIIARDEVNMGGFSSSTSDMEVGARIRIGSRLCDGDVCTVGVDV